jgi:hypothetical protein
VPEKEASVPGCFFVILSSSFDPLLFYGTWHVYYLFLTYKSVKNRNLNYFEHMRNKKEKKRREKDWLENSVAPRIKQ